MCLRTFLKREQYEKKDSDGVKLMIEFIKENWIWLIILMLNMIGGIPGAMTLWRYFTTGEWRYGI